MFDEETIQQEREEEYQRRIERRHDINMALERC
jgi:hypothetical protein